MKRISTSKCYVLLGLLWLLISPLSSFADDTVCARVKIEIRQEMTLERQAFYAHMRINNGLSHITLEDVGVDVHFSDEDGNSVLASSDPNNIDALFFIRLDFMENIDNVDGSGTVPPSTSADIHWLIIPAPGASNGLEQGTLYYVGATLIYTIGGEEHITEVYPDYIFVKPMPELTLDYFLPTDVYGDDAFTSEIEPSIPFSLGVRVRNNGSGVAIGLKIDSAQPKIVENEQELLIGFVIEGSEVNGQPATPSLLADFGDIEPNSSGVARWIMTCSLSGKFVEFNAEFSHSDELGGELTSLLEAVNTYFLVRDVLVDLPGRDNIRDFLAKDGGVYTVYESDSVDSSVLDQSASSSLELAGQSGSEVRYTLSTPVTAGFMYVQLSDPHNGQKVIKEVVRSDGKRIKVENTWLSKTREGSGPWQHFINLFDVNITDLYTFIFDDPAAGPQPPVLQFIPDRSRAESQQLSFIVEASDPDGTVPSLFAAPLPALATFTDQGDGTGIFNWTPAVGQAGQYEITFIASDGILNDSQRVLLTVYSIEDSDGDGMPDDWEMEHFGTLDRDGTGDFDGDGISDLDEYLNGTDPTLSNAPTIPEIYSPEDGAEVNVLEPDMVIHNSTDPDGDAITYEFEVYADQGMTNLVVSQLNVPEAVDKTSWTVPEALRDNNWYYWRVRATDGTCYSQWAYGSFFVNTENDPPGNFNISSPQDNSEVDTLLPVLQVTNSMDVDEDVINYTFEVYADSSMTTLIASASDIPEGEDGSTSWEVDTALNDNTWYFWRAIATDEHGATTETIIALFFVNTLNDAPEAPIISSPAIGSEVDVQELDLIINNAFDLDLDELIYFFELDKVNTFDSEAKESSGEISEGVDTTSWHISGLDDNTLYYWRVKANDGAAESTWVQGSFFVNTVNDNPFTPTLKNPGQGAWVETLTPTLKLNPSVDIDNDSLIYRFEVYSDESLTNMVAQGQSDTPEWVVSLELNDNTWYYWRAQAEDEHGATSSWMDISSFFVNNDGIDDPPEITIQQPSEDLVTRENSILIRWEDSDPDSNADIAIYYDTDTFGEDGTLIEVGLKEDPDEVSDSYLWDITGMEDGTYYVYATITDGKSFNTSYGNGAITIDRTSPMVDALPQGGTYDSTQIVTLYANETADIYYTTDGSNPTTDSLYYNAPIEITETTTITFMAMDKAGNQSEIMTETYTIEAGTTDMDGDGMSDNWELEYFGDLSRDGTGDFDEDGVSDLDEYLIGIDPINTDTDGDGHSDGDEINAGSDPNNRESIPNYPPVAEAGRDQNVITGEVVTLNGSDSYDPEGTTITFLWSFVEVPQGSSVTDAALSDVTNVKSTFTPDIDGTYRIELIVNDGDLDSVPDEVEIFATTPNVAPNADAGPDQNVVTGTTIYLDAIQSEDPDNGPEPLSYLWSFSFVPDESLLNDDDITDKDQAFASFIPDVDGIYVTRLTVSDGDLTSEDTVQIKATTQNVPPNGNAGDDMTISLGETAFLDGSASNDPDNGPDSLTYSWRFVSLPTGSELTNEDIYDADTVSPSFIPDIAGIYVIQLMVGDSLDFDSDNVAVTVVIEVVIPGDLDGDSDVDRDDLNILLSYRDQPASECLECDLDGDEIITALDARKLVLLCTRPRCATE